VNQLLEVPRGHLVAGQQFRDEGIVLLLAHGAVEVIIPITFTISGCAKNRIHINRFGSDDRCDGVVEIEVGTGQVADGTGQRIAGERTGGNDDDAFFRNFVDLFPDQGDQRMVFDLLRNETGKEFTVHCQCSSGRNPGGISGRHEQGAEPAHLLFEQADGVFQAGAAQRVGTDQFRKGGEGMGLGKALRLHFDQGDRDAEVCRLPGCFTAGKAAADDGNSLRGHSSLPPLSGISLNSHFGHLRKAP